MGAAAIAAILSAPVSIASVVLLFLPIRFDAEALRYPAHLLALEPADVESVRWGLLLDLVDSYEARGNPRRGAVAR
jgi:hypothetical protein